MPSPKSPPPLASFSSDGIPTELKAINRWAPWEARWNERRGKYDKVPAWGLSTNKPGAWRTFEGALTAFEAAGTAFAGLGFCVTALKGWVIVDLDRCVTDGALAPWAQEIVDQLDSYTEISPSGQGLRVLCRGEISADWTNHDVGIEVYAGHEARFLTFTGQHLPGAPSAVASPSPEVWAALEGRHARERTKAEVIDLNMPDLLDELALPDVSTLEITPYAKSFLLDGELRVPGGDRSRELHSTAVSLYSAGLDDAQVLSILASNPHAMDVALDHRRQDPDRALSYLWREHCVKGRAKAGSKVARLDDFEDVSTKPADGGAPGQPAAPAAKGPRFQFLPPDSFVDAPPLSWLVKRVLPKAEVGVLFGPSGAGKSFAVMDLAMAIARGIPWRDRVTAQGTVAYICAEGAGGFRLRLQAYSEFHGVPLAGLPFFVLGDAPNFLEVKDVKDLAAALKALPALSLVIVDTWAQVTAGANENSGEDMGRALAHCKALHRATGAMVLLVAHSGKDEGRGMRGWSGVKGALDVEIQVERSDDYRAMTVTKMKDGQGEGDEFGFALDSVVLGQDEDGEDITSCVIKATGAAPKAQRKAEPKGVWQVLLMRVARNLLELTDDVTTQQLVDLAVNEAPRGDEKKDRRRERILHALDSLVAVGRIATPGGKVVLP